MTDVFRVIPFPEPGFRVDEPAQSEVRLYAMRKDRKLKGAFVGMMAAFRLSVAFGLVHAGIGRG